MRLGPFIGGSGFFQLSVDLVHEIMSLGFAFDAIAFMKAGIEPLRTIRNAGLIQNAIDHLFIEDLGVF